MGVVGLDYSQGRNISLFFQKELQAPLGCYGGAWQGGTGASPDVYSARRALPAATVAISWSCAHWDTPASKPHAQWGFPTQQGAC